MDRYSCNFLTCTLAIVCNKSYRCVKPYKHSCHSSQQIMLGWSLGTNPRTSKSKIEIIQFVDVFLHTSAFLSSILQALSLRATTKFTEMKLIYRCARMRSPAPDIRYYIMHKYVLPYTGILISSEGNIVVVDE